METSFQIVDQGYVIPCMRNEPDSGPIRRVVLGVHGLGGSMEDAIQRSLAEEMPLFGSAVLRFDLPAHGSNPLESDGFTVENCVRTLLSVARWARLRYSEVEDLCVFATGFGAYITLCALEELLELPGKIKLVVQTPSVVMHDTLLTMVRMSRETFWAMDAFTCPVKRPFTVTYKF